MWSIGCVLFECITGQVPFDENALCKLFLHVACKNYSSYKPPLIPKSTSAELTYVTTALLDINAKTRLTANQLHNCLVGDKPSSSTSKPLDKNNKLFRPKLYTCFTDDDLRRQQPHIKVEHRWKTLEYCV